MFKRLGTLVVALVVLVAGISACPGTGNCSIMRQVTHDCCEGKRAPAPPDDCCAQKADHPDRSLGTHTSADLSVLPVIPASWQANVAGTRGWTAPPQRATIRPRPPDTLLSHQTSLLL